MVCLVLYYCSSGYTLREDAGSPLREAHTVIPIKQTGTTPAHKNFKLQNFMRRGVGAAQLSFLTKGSAVLSLSYAMWCTAMSTDWSP